MNRCVGPIGALVAPNRNARCVPVTARHTEPVQMARRGVTAVANPVGSPAPNKPADPNRTGDAIRPVLFRAWFASGTVHIAASGNIATPSGPAAPYFARTPPLETAWASPGTSDAVNHIRIG
jgi:hypothetical protein